MRSLFWRGVRAALLAGPLRRTLLTAPLEGVAAELAHRVATEDVLLHGTAADVDVFEPRPQTDFDGNPAHGVFATDDPVWPIFFAVADARHLVNGCFHVSGERRYFFSVDTDATWRDGWVYALPRATFARHPSGPEWLSPVRVMPLDRIHVTPDDFPFLHDVVRHRRGARLIPVVTRATILRR
jgi:hypothetical protein